MRICYIADINSIHTQRIVHYYSNGGHKVDVLSLNKPEYSKIGNKKRFNIHYIGPLGKGWKLSPKFILNQIKIIRRVKKLLKKLNPDILHAFFITDHGLYGALSNFHPFVVFAMGSDIFINPYRNILYRITYKFVLKRAEFIHCETQYAKEKLCSNGTPLNKIMIFPFGIDLNLFRYKEKNKRLLGLLNLSLNNKIIISTRNLEIIYGIKTLINAIPKIINSFPEARFLIIGKGSLENYLKELVNKYKIDKYIRFVGYIENSEMPEYLNLADIYISTSLYDTFSISTLEAMACAKPVVVTDIPGTEEWIKDFKNGLLFEKQNHNDLAEKIEFLLDNNYLSKEMGENNRRIVEQKADVLNFMNNIDQTYSILLD